MDVSALPDDNECKRGRWTKEEDARLRQAVEEFGERHWKSIAERVSARTPIQCLHRWTKILKPGLVKGPWSREEDQQVIEWVQRHGPTKWAQCAEAIQGRSGKQCRERWSNTLDPFLKKGDWTESEDKIIFSQYRLRGPKWTEIAKLLPGRSENSIKNRFYSTLRKAKPKDNPESTGDSEISKSDCDLTSLLSSSDNSAKSAACLQVITLLRQLQKLESMLGETRKQICCLEESIENEEKEEESSALIIRDDLF